MQFSLGAPNNVEGIPTTISPVPDVDVARCAGEIHSAPGTTAVFCSPSDLFYIAHHSSGHWEASSQSLSHIAHSTSEFSVACCVASGRVPVAWC